MVSVRCMGGCRGGDNRLLLIMTALCNNHSGANECQKYKCSADDFSQRTALFLHTE